MSNKTTPSTGDRKNNNSNVSVEEVPHDEIEKKIHVFFDSDRRENVKCIIGPIGVPSIDSKAYTTASGNMPKWVEGALRDDVLTISLSQYKENPSPQKNRPPRRSMRSTRRLRTTTSTKKTARDREDR